MYVEQIMSSDVESTTLDTKLSKVSTLMHDNERRFLPVVDANHKLLGIITHRELERAEPSSITTLSVGEVNYLMSNLTAEKVMVADVISCTPTTLVEEAGRIMREQHIGCLPVIDADRKLLGIITDVDILDFLLDITGSNLPDTTRLTVHLPDDTGVLGKLLDSINELGGYIATIVSPVSLDETGQRIAIVRYTADDPQKLDSELRSRGYDLITEALPNDNSGEPTQSQPETTPTEAQEIAAWMLQHDALARQFGIRLGRVEPGYCEAWMKVRSNMLNAVGMTHGGTSFALADFAFAVASNSHGTTAVSLNAQIVYPASSSVGDVLTATAREQHLGSRNALYTVEVRNQDDTIVALFTGTAFRRQEPISQWMHP